MTTATVTSLKVLTPKSPLSNLTLPADNYNIVVIPHDEDNLAEIAHPVAVKYGNDLEELAYREEMYDIYNYYLASDRHY